MLVPTPAAPEAGDIALARLEKIGKNARLELGSGRAASLHEGDLIAVVFGNRYATNQFEGYAASKGDSCDLMSMGGLCGLVASRHASIAEPSKLRLLGAIADGQGRPLHLGNYALPQISANGKPKVTVVCGTSMDAGKTHTVTSLVAGLARAGRRVAAVKLTGTAAGKDTWTMSDAGAFPALDFVDGGFVSTYMCTLKQLLSLYELLISHAAAQGAEAVIVEIADGLLQRETALLIREEAFTSTLDNFVLAASDSMGAVAGVALLRSLHLEPLVISGLLTQSPLGIRETVTATALACLTAGELQAGKLNPCLVAADPAIAASEMSAVAGAA